MPQTSPKVKVTKDGPYTVSGNVPLSKQIIIPDKEGYSERWKGGGAYPQKETYDLCRCGQSRNKPYCDKTHLKVRFDGKETASRKPYSTQAKKTDGPTLDLYDNIKLCSSARFCDRCGGTWKLTEESNKQESRKTAIQEACDCPSGRLVIHDKKSGNPGEPGNPIEPSFTPSIGIVEDPEAEVSGPIWVRGRIPVISSDGAQYEIRNRVTLCRCGQSKNKPFCDGTHIPIGFSDSDSSLNKKKDQRD